MKITLTDEPTGKNEVLEVTEMKSDDEEEREFYDDHDNIHSTITSDQDDNSSHHRESISALRAKAKDGVSRLSA